MRLVLIIVACAAAAFGQRHKIEEVNAEKPEGKLLQQIMQENDAAKKTALLDQFSGEFPKHDSTPWVLEQLQGIYVKANDPDKIIATGDKLLALDPDDPEAALQCMKAAEAKKDGPAIKKYSMATWAAARKMAAAPQPKEADEVDGVEGVGGIRQTGGAVRRLRPLPHRPGIARRQADHRLGEALIARNPQGEYSIKVMEPLFVAYRQAGDNAKAAALAEKAVAGGQGNEDMLLVLANQYLEQKKEPEKVHTYTAKIVQQMGQKPKPEGVSDGDWTARKNLYHGAGALPERQAVSQREQFRQGRRRTARRAAAGGRQRGGQTGGAVHAGALQFQTRKAAGGSQLFPRLRRHQESLPADGEQPIWRA